MKIVAHTDTGFLIEATSEEIQEILSSVLGKKPETIKIGDKIPAIDYASSIRKIKSLKSDHNWQTLVRYHKSFSESLNELEKKIEDATNIDSI